MAKPERIIQTSNLVAWLAIGAALGWLSTRVWPSGERVVLIETLVVGIFGSFIGGEFVGAFFREGTAEVVVSAGTVAMAGACSIAALAALALMRRAVGPLRSGKSKARRS